jgi:hypothetical protein
MSQALNPPPNITECNGSAAICSRKYSNVSLIGTHGSAHIGSIHDWRINRKPVRMYLTGRVMKGPDTNS